MSFALKSLKFPKPYRTAALCSVLCFSASASSQNEPREASLDEAISVCSQIKNKNARLECFDSLSGALEEVEEKKSASAPSASAPATMAPVTITPAPSAKEKKADADNLENVVDDTASGETASGEPETDAPSEQQFLIVTKTSRNVEEIRPSPFTAEIVDIEQRRGKFFITLDTGEVWKQTSYGRPRTPKKGQDIEFSRGLAGGWFAEIPGRTTKFSVVRVK